MRNHEYFRVTEIRVAREPVTRDTFADGLSLNKLEDKIMEGSQDNLFNLDDYRPAVEHDYRRVERINGIKMPLGSMAVDELDGVIGHCQERVTSAQTDLQMAQDYRDHRFPQPPDAAA